MFINSLKQPIEKYLLTTSSNPVINKFAKSLSKQIYPTISCLAKVNTNDYTVFTNEISKAPHDLKVVFNNLFYKKPTSYSELIETVEDIKNICHNNPKAKEFMVNFQEFVNNDKHANSLVKKVSKGTYDFINIFFKKNNNGKYFADRGKYIESAKDLFNSLTQHNIFTHINEMFKYILK